MKKALVHVALVFACAAGAFGAQYEVLWNFGSIATDGANPISSLISDTGGNLYGTTPVGGNAAACASCGAVFKLSRNSDGSWTNTVIHAFCSTFVNSQCTDGLFPQAGLVIDSAGNLYGTTMNGGNVPCSANGNGCGVVFELSPNLDGSFSETVLYNFCQNANGGLCVDGYFPFSQLSLDTLGNLYGTTSQGGNGHLPEGTVFELSPGANGWTETILYNFCQLGTRSFCLDGAQPLVGVTFDPSGNLYGVASSSGSLFKGGGLVYELVPNNGVWNEVIVHDFANTRSAITYSGIAFDTAGNLYGSLSYGGPIGAGGVFRVSSSGAIRNFFFDGWNGSEPMSGVLVSDDGTVFGTASGIFGGTAGTVFSIRPSGKEVTRYSFCTQPNCADGYEPEGGLLQDKAGHLYGTTRYGGAFGFGVIFEIKP